MVHPQGAPCLETGMRCSFAAVPLHVFYSRGLSCVQAVIKLFERATSLCKVVLAHAAVVLAPLQQPVLLQFQRPSDYRKRCIVHMPECGKPTK
eukprot:5346211-Amphidinium_carterae.1